MSLRSRAVSAALREWRDHPAGRPDVYWRAVLRPQDYPFTGDWCGGYALWALQQAGIARRVPWIVGHGFIGPQKLPSTRTPLPGDIAVVPSPFQHQAMVVQYEPATGMVTTIDGNQPGIEPRVRFVGNGNLEFYSIEPLVAEAQGAAFPWGYVLGGAAVAAAAATAYLWPRGRA